MVSQQQIKNDLKEAMKSKQKTKVSVLRNISSEITNELLNQGKTPQDELGDDGVLKVIERLAKQRRDSISQYEGAGRAESAEAEKEELEVLESYLPEKMSEEEIQKVVNDKKEELGVSDTSSMGELMKAVMNEVKGKADGSVVKQKVEESLK